MSSAIVPSAGAPRPLDFREPADLGLLSDFRDLRCLTGSSGREHSMVFHFDSHVLALLLPIEVPAGKDNGELIVLPNIRAIRRRYASNLIDKILVRNPVSQRILRGMTAMPAARMELYSGPPICFQSALILPDHIRGDKASAFHEAS